MNNICKNPVSKWGHILSFQMDKDFGGRHMQTVSGKGLGQDGSPWQSLGYVGSWLRVGKISRDESSDLESTFIKTGDSETNEEFGIEEARPQQ